MPQPVLTRVLSSPTAAGGGGQPGGQPGHGGRTAAIRAGILARASVVRAAAGGGDDDCGRCGVRGHRDSAPHSEGPAAADPTLPVAIGPCAGRRGFLPRAADGLLVPRGRAACRPLPGSGCSSARSAACWGGWRELIIPGSSGGPPQPPTGRSRCGRARLDPHRHHHHHHRRPPQTTDAWRTRSRTDAPEQ